MILFLLGLADGLALSLIADVVFSQCARGLEGVGFVKNVTFDQLVPSSTRSWRSYRITGSLSCECTGFGTHGHCKHLRHALEVMMAPVPRKRKAQDLT